jgi:hypothetical protein
MWGSHSDAAEDEIFWDVRPCRLANIKVSKNFTGLIFRVKESMKIVV